jgi:very-short-patch-repair endonuclease
MFWSSKNGNIKPRDVFKYSHSKCSFVCEKGHKFNSPLSHITRGQWCPKCINKTETKLYEIMVQLFPSIITQFKQDWCKNKNYLPFDFCIPECKVIIELDGIQHREQVSNWKSPEEQFKNDKYKEKCANENGYSTIRIVQEDVWNDNYDWCKELCEAIENIKNGDKVVNIYLCKNNEYDLFM